MKEKVKDLMDMNAVSASSLEQEPRLQEDIAKKQKSPEVEREVELPAY